MAQTATAQWQAPPRSGPRIGRVRLFVAGAVILAAIGYLVATSLQNNAVYYMTVSELQARSPSMADQGVRVAGNVVPGSIQRDPAIFLVNFRISDDSGEIPVTYKGVLPDIFGDRIQVVVEGKYAEGQPFNATTLLAKCPSKFTDS